MCDSKTDPLIAPIVFAVPLQMLAYHRCAARYRYGSAASWRSQLQSSELIT